jgi:hypothetical protein
MPLIGTPSSIDATPMFDEEVAFDQDRSTNDLIIKRYQHIPDNFVAKLKAGKMDSKNTPAGDMMLAMSVPVSVIEDIKAKFHFDMMQEPIKRSMTMLRALGLDAFITTTKSF